MIQDADELIEAIRHASDLASKWEPDHPQYVEGRFYLTDKQWAAIRKEWPRREGFNDGQSVWGIPVDIIRPGEHVKLPSGKTLLYSQLMRSLCVFDPALSGGWSNLT